MALTNEELIALNKRYIDAAKQGEIYLIELMLEEGATAHAAAYRAARKNKQTKAAYFIRRYQQESTDE